MAVYLIPGRGGVGPVAPTLPLVQGIAGVGDITPTTIGGRAVAAGDYINATFRFVAVLLATPGRTANLRLWNQTDGSLVTTLTTTSTTGVLVTSGTLSLPAASKVYEAQLWLDSSSGPSDQAVCLSAELTLL